MNLNVDLEGIKQPCRICLKNGDINIWYCKISLQLEYEENSKDFCVNDTTKEKSFMEIVNIVFNGQDLLNFTEEFPLLCMQCLEDLKFCYTFYEKVKLANVQLRNLYEESLNSCIEEEHLVELVEENYQNYITDTNIIEFEPENLNVLQYTNQNTDTNIIELNPENLNVLQYESNDLSRPGNLNKTDSFIVTQFIPETLEVTQQYEATNNDNECPSAQNLLTVNLKAVEVKDLQDLDKLQSLDPVINDIVEPAIYMCQYCPKAFTKSDYLKTHVQKCHVCKFCTQPFSVTEELFTHIRKIHTENKCAICRKLFSSGTNLRHHIKGVHGIKLPPKVTLIDYIKSTDVQENEVDILQEVEAEDVNYYEENVWKNENSLNASDNSIV